MFRLFTATVIVTAMLPLTLHAQQSGAPVAPNKAGVFEALDRDRDGKVTRDEFFADFEYRYLQFLSRLDANKDNVVTREEFMTDGRPGTQRMSQAR